MRVLWIANNPLQIIREQLIEQSGDGRGGWLDGSAEEIIRHKDVELFYCFPNKEKYEGTVKGIGYYSVPKAAIVRYRNIKSYKKSDFERFKDIVDKVCPDIIHIWGTETWYQRQFVQMARDMGVLGKTIIWIQGLVCFYANSYFGNLSIGQIKQKTLWERLRKTNVEGIQKRMVLNGKSERKILKMAKNVFIRTEWDEACCLAINQNIRCYRCNETLRKNFYSYQTWNLECVEKHSIFLSQWQSPIKGFYKMLKALVIILKKFPDVIVYTTGQNPLRKQKTVLENIREPSYECIIREIIIRNHLENNIHFLGTLQSEEMRERYLKSHVFVSASSIENSPNSVGEAMLLGVPIVASDVGGVSSLITHKEEGLLYPFNEYAVLAQYICKIFYDDQYAKQLSCKARARALRTHDPENNYRTLVKCYREIMEHSGVTVGDKQ